MNYKVGDVIDVVVTGIEKYGIFVNTENGFSGLIHISEISSLFVKNVLDYAKIGEVIKAKVLEVDEKKRHLKLSIKDFDYRISKKTKMKIVETKSGFSNLKKHLNVWIEEKLEEMAENTKK